MLQFLTKPFMLGSEDMSSKNKDRLASPELYKVEGSELEAFIPKEPKRLTDLKQSQLTALKILTSFFGFSTLLLCVYTIVLKRGEVARCSTRENPTSDFGPMRHIIEYIPVRFTGNVEYFANGSVYVPPESVTYVGDPSQEIDDAWFGLIKARDPIISEKEAKKLWPDNYQDFWHHKKQGYVVGFEVFHSLHCLNSLRKRLSPDYYGFDNSYAQNLHRDHCINQIRQTLMCSADMTPYGTRYNKVVDHNYADSDVVHTCRNFEKIREWVFDRYYNPPPQSPIPNIKN